MIMNMKRKFHFLIAALLIANTLCSAALDPMPTDAAFPWNFDLPDNTYHKFCKNIYSQNGEDGIIEQLLKELEIHEGTFCEFGASNGIASSNTYNLIKNFNFSGIEIEMNRSRFQQCVNNYKAYPNVQVFHGPVLYGHKKFNLNTWLKKGNLPSDLDLLSIDIDCDDYYVWDDLTEYAPKIVVIEANSYRDPVYQELPRKPSQEYNLDPLKQWFPERIALGCSFISAVELGLKKGYIPVSFTGNLTFVRKDLIHKLHDFPYIISDDPYDYITLYTPLVLWGDKWYTNTGLLFNTAIRDYYQIFKIKHIDADWIKARMNQILNSSNDTSRIGF